MSPREPAAYAFDVVGACRRVREYVGAMSREHFVADTKTRDAVERQLLVIGEAIVQLRKIRPELAARLGPADQIAGFRNVLAHAYFRVDPGEVWTIVQIDVPRLQIEAERMLAEFPPPESI